MNVSTDDLSGYLTDTDIYGLGMGQAGIKAIGLAGSSITVWKT